MLLQSGAAAKSASSRSFREQRADGGEQRPSQDGSAAERATVSKLKERKLPAGGDGEAAEGIGLDLGWLHGFLELTESVCQAGFYCGSFSRSFRSNILPPAF